MRYMRLWLGLGAVIVGSFTVLGYFGRELYRQAHRSRTGSSRQTGG